MTVAPGTTVEVEADGDEIARLAYAELEAEKSGQPLPEPKKKPEPEPKDEQPSETKPSDEAAEPVADEGEPAKEGDSQDTTPKAEDKQDDKPVEPKADAVSEEDIQKHALKHGMTYSDAKDEIVKTRAIVEKYKNDPLEMARALRSTQSAYDKIKAEKDSKPSVDLPMPTLDWAKKETEANRDKILDMYRANHPHRTASMEDEAILEWAAHDLLAWGVNETKAKSETIKKQAADRREKLLASIPKDDVKFIPDVKIILDRTPDSQVADEGYDVSNVVFWAKGQRYNDDVKAAYERGLKAGREAPKIVGELPSGSGSKPAPKVGPSGLNQKQIARAVEMFPPDDGYSTEQAIKEFQEVHKDDLKKNPSFVN